MFVSIIRQGPPVTLDNVLKADMETFDGILVEHGIDHCLAVALNILAGGRVLHNLNETLGLVNKMQLDNRRVNLAKFIKKRGCKFGDQPILPYMKTDGTVVWLKLQVTELGPEDTVRVLSCANHFNDYLEQFPERVLIQIIKLPFSYDSQFHSSHAINAKFGGEGGEWYLRDTEDDWYSTRSYTEDKLSRLHSSKFFNTFKDAAGLRFFHLTPPAEDGKRSEATGRYMNRVAENPNLSLTKNMFQQGPGNPSKATADGDKARDDGQRSHQGKARDRRLFKRE